MYRGAGTHLLLLHELRIRAIVNNISTKDWGSQDSVDLLGIDILELSVEDEVVTGWTHRNSRFFPE